MMLRVVSLAALLVGSVAMPTAGAQDWSVAPATGGKAEAPAGKARSKGTKASSSVQHLSPEGAKATRLEENRKKFFEQSSGFDNGRSVDLPISAGSGANGQFQPGMGFKF